MNIHILLRRIMWQASRFGHIYSQEKRHLLPILPQSLSRCGGEEVKFLPTLLSGMKAGNQHLTCGNTMHLAVHTQLFSLFFCPD